MPRRQAQWERSSVILWAHDHWYDSQMLTDTIQVEWLGMWLVFIPATRNGKEKQLTHYSFKTRLMSTNHTEVTLSWRMPINDTGVTVSKVLNSNLDFIHHPS